LRRPRASRRCSSATSPRSRWCASPMATGSSSRSGPRSPARSA